MEEINSEKPKWYFTKKFLITALLMVGPLALPLLWINPKISTSHKILWTVIILGLTYALGALNVWAYQYFMNFLNSQGMGIPQ